MATKRDFSKENPALAYISSANGGEPKEGAKAPDRKEQGEFSIYDALFKDENGNDINPFEKKKETGTGADEVQAPAPKQSPVGALPETGTPVVRVSSPESKSKRVQLLMQPSVLNAAKARAAARGLSLNEYISQLVKSDLEKG